MVVISVRAGLMQLADLGGRRRHAVSGDLCVAADRRGFSSCWEIFWSVLRDLFERCSRIPWQKYDVPIMTGCALVTAIVTLALERWSGSDRPLMALCLGAFFWWLVLSLATALWLPGASYLFVWPTLAGLLGLGISVQLRPGSVLAWVTTVLCSIPSLATLASSDPRHF